MIWQYSGNYLLYLFLYRFLITFCGLVKDTMPVVGFIRTKVLQADKPGGLTSPFVAVNVKEAMNIPGECRQLACKT